MIRKLRLASGLLLFFFVATHLLNHALGLISLAAMDRGAAVILFFWQTWLGMGLLYGAFALHIGLAFLAVYRRRNLIRIPRAELAQLLLGLSIPPLLILHVLGTRAAESLAGVDSSYVYVLLIYFLYDPLSGWQQVAAMLVAWGHGCFGLYFWLRYRPWFARLRSPLLALVTVFPMISLAGVLAGGREVQRLAADPAWLEQARARIDFASGDELRLLIALENGFLGLFLGLLLAVLAARALRRLVERRRGLVEIAYVDGKRVRVTPGTTLLEASRGAGIPHASLCGGRGRCSTCRVEVSRGLEDLPVPSEAERKVLDRLGLGARVRLACQTRPGSAVTVTPLLPAAATARDAFGAAGHLQGSEREVVILFADLRGFTSLAEQKLPYDVVFLLNRYFRATGQAIEEAGGHVDKFIGDGVMALFGLEQPIEAACRSALEAAQRMAEAIEEINATLASDLPQPLRIGIGV
ncbi:MAG: adenylate/guanylate cyclase domain-containing protein, partial [Rhodovibrionaceae bacterium]